jgi:hypothetical protein
VSRRFGLRGSCDSCRSGDIAGADEFSFTEMPTNRFVESAFWNFDAMFVPQQHPARELQDTFYVKGECGVARLAIWASGHLGVWMDRPGIEGVDADADTT